MRNITLGILAHVDAGKTTLSEALLFASGTIDALGRVDKRSSFLDTHSLERERGITIFSKQAIIETENGRITLLDTPGHIDFSCEAERALSVEDYAILVINAQNGVQSHTKTLWRLLRARSVPTFIFVNKMDIAHMSRRELMSEIRKSLSVGCADFSTEEITEEEIAGADEELMLEYFDTGHINMDLVKRKIKECVLFPTFFGSALKMTGIKEFLSKIDSLFLPTKYPEKLFGARVYKIGRDKNGERLTYMKITGGTLSARDTVYIRTDCGVIEEKINSIRLYSGDKFKVLKSCERGMLVAVTGCEHTRVGGGLGIERDDEPTLTPVLDYRMILPSDINPYDTYLKLSVLREEDPSLAITYSERAKEIRVRLMGPIQLEVLKRIISERLGIEVTFDEGAILYKETVVDTVIGRGHFEPLRHYAEVHLKIEPMPEGSGIVTATECPTDILGTNWQRLIMTHIEERVHHGVLTGAPLTDVKITIVTGRAHQKHTEGGDFRQATYRAIRQGLMKAKSRLLEPTFDFRIELPEENVGRCMRDIDEAGGTLEGPFINGGVATLVGSCPVSTMRAYATTLRAYTKGEGKITLSVGRYVPCHNEEEVIAERGYNPLLDERNTPSSVFCRGGSGYAVPWDEADALMHCEIDKDGEIEEYDEDEVVAPRGLDYHGSLEEDRELMRIFEATYGKIKPRYIKEKDKKENSAPKEKTNKGRTRVKKTGEKYVIIDGYNFIFGWDFLRRYAEGELALARDILIRIMASYSAFYKTRVIIVFDAYKREDNDGSVENIGGVSVVYTKHKELADTYIEIATHSLSPDNEVRVVTGDYSEQLVVLGAGGLRVSISEFAALLEEMNEEIGIIIKSIK